MGVVVPSSMETKGIPVYSCGFSAEGFFYLCGDGKEFTYKKDAKEYCEANGLNPDNIQKLSNPEPVENALHSVKIMLQSIIDDTGADEYSLYLTGDGNFRESVATILPYKGNRVQPKPTHYQAIRDYMVGVWGAEIVDGMEADDKLAIEQMKTYYQSEPFAPEGHTDTIICSIDKDLNMIEGWHYNWQTQEKYFVSKDEGRKCFYTQLLTGDRTDNIQGIPGIGKQKAAKLLNGCETEEEMYEAVVGAYEAYYNTLEEEEVEQIVRENANLLWIVKELNDKGEPVLWTPPCLIE